MTLKHLEWLWVAWIAILYFIFTTMICFWVQALYPTRCVFCLFVWCMIFLLFFCSLPGVSYSTVHWVMYENILHMYEWMVQLYNKARTLAVRIMLLLCAFSNDNAEGGKIKKMPVNKLKIRLYSSIRRNSNIDYTTFIACLTPFRLMSHPFKNPHRNPTGPRGFSTVPIAPCPYPWESP